MCSSFDPIEHHMQQNSIQKVKKESVKKKNNNYVLWLYLCCKIFLSENTKAVSVMLCVCACVWERTPQHSII